MRGHFRYSRAHLHRAELGGAATSSATGRVAGAVASRSPAAAIGRGEKGRRKK